MSTEDKPGQPLWILGWGTLDMCAWWLLEHSENLNPRLISDEGLRFGLQRLRLWDDAMGFGCEHQPFTLTVFHPFHPEATPIVRKAVWQRTPDLRHLSTSLGEDYGRAVPFEPTITVQDAPLPAGDLERVLEKAMSLRLPLVWFDPTETVTDDVGSFGFEFCSLSQPQARLRLEWSFDIPADWQPVVDWATRVRDFLEGCLSQVQ
jgi:hypothetical protein